MREREREGGRGRKSPRDGGSEPYPGAAEAPGLSTLQDGEAGPGGDAPGDQGGLCGVSQRRAEDSARGRQAGWFNTPDRRPFRFGWGPRRFVRGSEPQMCM